MVYPYFLCNHKDFLIILIMWDSVSQKTEDHNKLGTSAVASKEKIWSNFQRVCTQIHIHIYIFSFPLAAISKFLGRYMTNHIEYFART